MRKYDTSKIEPKWQKYWEKEGIYKAQDFSKKKKWYSLIEFPYPSGQGLHIGHVRSNTAMDIISRKRRMEGHNVLYPIGWDAFGLPTENYAVKTGIHPAKVTKTNTAIFRKQLKRLGFSFDWDREIDTTDPAYYKWTQWIFLQFFKKGLAYKGKTTINWCPSCKIGLANEEVVAGNCERCGHKVEEKVKEQWMLKITAYADKLLNGLKEVDFLPEIKRQQENWIGRSEGTEIDFAIAETSEVITVFTTRPDTLFGATYMVLSPEHPIISKLAPMISNYEDVSSYIKKAIQKTEEERLSSSRAKTGIRISGINCVNPATKKEIPVFVADYVLSGYGTGAIMAVPAHDERDAEFALAFNLPSVVVVSESGDLVDSGKFSGLSSQSAKKEITKFVGGRTKVNYHLRDWIFSRQRYWGEPIPLVHCAHCLEKSGNAITINFSRQDSWDALVSGGKTIETRALNPEEPNRYFGNVGSGDFLLAVNKQTSQKQYLFVKKVWKFKNLKDLFKKPESFLRNIATDKNEKPQYKKWLEEYAKNSPDYLEKIEKNGLIAWEVEAVSSPDWIAVPEKDLPIKLPNLKEFKPRDDGESPLKSAKGWLKSKCPRCGKSAERETDVMPNWAGSSWYFLRYIDPKNKKAFADPKKLKYWMNVDWYNGGMEHVTLHLLYSRFWNQFLSDLGLVPYSEPYTKRTAHGMILGEGGIKMSKSRGNVINPDDVVRAYGADTLRLYEMFMGPFDQSIAWDPRSIEGLFRFLNRVWFVSQSGKVSIGGKNDEIAKLTEKTLKKVSADIEKMSFNTAISSMMILSNEMQKAEKVPEKSWRKFLLMLAPFAPFIAEELWQQISGGKKMSSVHLEKWPQWDEKLAKDDNAKVVVQINGKLRAELLLPSGTSAKDAEKEARGMENVAKFLEGQSVRKVIYVPDRLINFVI